MKKKFRVKRKFKYKKIFSIFLILLIIYTLFKYDIPNIKFNSTKEFIINYVFENDIKRNKNIIDHKVSNDIFNNPVLILQQEFGITTNNEQIQTIKPIEEVITKPKIYIYSTHQKEQYNYQYLENYNIVPDVLMASLMLKEKLEELNIATIVEENDITKYMKENNLNYAESYIASRYFLSKILEQYNNLDLYIDLHRDAAKHSVTYTNINGKDCAKVLFVVGLENPNYKYNLEVVNKLNNIILEKYPTLSRGILKKEGYGVNGIYNQDLHHNVILLEVGGYENNIDEINNTLDLIAEVIGEYINEKEKK